MLIILELKMARGKLPSPKYPQNASGSVTSCGNSNIYREVCKRTSPLCEARHALTKGQQVSGVISRHNSAIKTCNFSLKSCVSRIIYNIVKIYARVLKTLDIKLSNG